jgi:hypothetical protein
MISKIPVLTTWGIRLLSIDFLLKNCRARSLEVVENLLLRSLSVLTHLFIAFCYPVQWARLRLKKFYQELFDFFSREH